MVKQSGGKKIWRRTAAVLVALVLCAVVSPWMGVMAGAHTFNHDTDLSMLVDETTNTIAKPVSDNTNFYLSRDLSTRTPIKINAGATVNLCLNGHTLTYTGTSTSFITVLEGAELNIYDCSAGSAVVTSAADNTEITIPAGHIFTTKAIISNTGTFNLHSGALTGSTTTSITNNSGAVFNMSGGMIAGCQGSTNGGAVYNNKGTFTMSGGEITGNSGGTGSGGVKNAGTFRLSGNAKIARNTGTTGGGVINTGTSAVMEMIGGEISGNTATTSGGGIHLASGTVTVSGGTITGNSTDKTGGGIHTAGGTLAVAGGEISGNTAKTDGGGVYVNGTVSVAGAPVITGNTADGSGDNVYLYATSTTAAPKTITVAGGFSGSIGVVARSAPAYNKAITIAVPGENYAITESDVKHFTDESGKESDGYTLQLDDSGNMVLKYNPQKESPPENVAIDYEEETITWTPGGTSSKAVAFLVNGVETSIKTTPASLDVNDYLGTTVSIQKKGAAATSSIAPTLDSDPAEIEVPARPAAPDVTVDNETLAGLLDGKLHGVTADMEFRDASLSTSKWNSISSDMIQENGDVDVNTAFWRAVKGSSTATLKYPVTMQVRVKASNDLKRFSSEVAEVTVAASEEAQSMTFEVTAPAFESVEYGYAQPDAKPITIRNTGNVDLPISKAAISTSPSTNFALNSTDGVTIPVGGSSTLYTVQPNTGLAPKNYTATVTFTYKKPGASTTSTEKVTVTFEVTTAHQDPPPAVTVNTFDKSSITIDTLTNEKTGQLAEYSVDGGATWKGPTSSTATTYKITNLDPGTEYSIIARYKASTSTTKYYEASEPGPICKASTAAATSYTITFNANGGTVSPTSGTTGPNGKLASCPTPTRDNYTFIGWFTSLAGTTQVDADYVFTRAMAIYAHWAQNEYNLTLNLGDGIVYPSLTKYRYGVVTALPEPTKDGFRFAGWHTDEACTSEPVTEISATDLGDKTFYAKWEEASVPTPVPTPTPIPTPAPTPTPGGTPTAEPTDGPSGPGGGSSGDSMIWDSGDPYEVPVLSETRVPVVRLVVPESVGFIVNPYRLEVNAEHLGGGAAETGQIICPTQYIENRSEAPVSVAISVTGTCADTVSFASAPPASGGGKSAFLQLAAQAVADGQASIAAGAEKTTLSLEESVPSPVVLSPEGGANSWLAFAFTGSVQDAPDEPWTEEDTFGAVLVFRFTLMTNPAA